MIKKVKIKENIVVGAGKRCGFVILQRKMLSCRKILNFHCARKNHGNSISIFAHVNEFRYAKQKPVRYELVCDQTDDVDVNTFGILS